MKLSLLYICSFMIFQLFFLVVPDIHATGDYGTSPFIINTPVESRSISFENPTGEKGGGGKASSILGPGRKGSPKMRIKPGKTITLCNLEGPGIIRHFWVTMSEKKDALLGLVLRAYWEGQEHPSIEAPIGNFFGISHGSVQDQVYESAVHSINYKGGMNFWLPMPFKQQARITITNEGRLKHVLFFSLDYTLHDSLEEPFGRLHVLFRRENPTTLKKDFVILPQRTGMGRFMGCVLGIRPLEKSWWGEGEVKMYLDGDTEFPTIVSTGTEDYIGQAWGLKRKAYLYGGAPLSDRSNGFFSLYRWHIQDPIYWKKNIRVTVQQIGLNEDIMERQDDWSTSTFWYESVPSAPLPPMPSYDERAKDLIEQPDPNQAKNPAADAGIP